MTSREGGCLCGTVRYRVEGDPTRTNYCHCRMCQRNAGAPVVAWATWPLAAFAIVAGEPGAYRSSERAQRLFCRSCGTPLFWQRVAPPSDSIDIAAASLDEPGTVVPTDHIWTESQLPWFDVRDDLPRKARG